MGLLSGVIAATAYLQVTALGRVGEPEYRIVFYFSLGGAVVGAADDALDRRPACAQLARRRPAARRRRAGDDRPAHDHARLRQRPPLVNASLQYLGIAWSFGYGVLLFGDHVTAIASRACC